MKIIEAVKPTRIDEVQKLVGNALTRLFRDDSGLFERNVNERSITHKLAEYLQQEFEGWNVDCEYNRHLDEVKRVSVPMIGVQWDDLESKTVFPDIIVHERGNDERNLLVIEVKKSTSTVPESFDKNKLSAFRREPFRYKFGLFIRFHVRPDTGNPTLEWFTS